MPEKEKYEENEAMTGREASRFRAAARINYLVTDRADSQFAAKDLSRSMAAPTYGDWDRARKTAPDWETAGLWAAVAVRRPSGMRVVLGLPQTL